MGRMLHDINSIWRLRRGQLPRLPNPKNRPQAALDILRGSFPTRNADPHRGAPVPLGAAAPAGAIILHVGNHALSLIGATK
jgi:hypothetical protein